MLILIPELARKPVANEIGYLPSAMCEHNEIQIYIGDASLGISSPVKQNFSLNTVEIEPASFGLLVQCSANSATRSSRFVCDISELSLVLSI